MPQFNKKLDKIVIITSLFRGAMLAYFAQKYTHWLYVGAIPYIIIIWCYIVKHREDIEDTEDISDKVL